LKLEDPGSVDLGAVALNILTDEVGPQLFSVEFRTRETKTEHSVEIALTVWIYVDTRKQAGDKDHLRDLLPKTPATRSHQATERPAIAPVFLFALIEPQPCVVDISSAVLQQERCTTFDAARFLARLFVFEYGNVFCPALENWTLKTV
jgi:hypothetical protein